MTALTSRRSSRVSTLSHFCAHDGSENLDRTRKGPSLKRTVPTVNECTNSWAVACASLFIFVQRRRYVAHCSTSPSSPSNPSSLSILLLLCRLWWCLLLLILSCPRFLISAFASALCCVLSRPVSAPSDLSVLPPPPWLCCQHWLAFALTNHAHLQTLSPPPLLPLSPLKIMPGCCDDDFLLCCAAPPLPACSARGTSPCPCPVPIGDCPPSRAPSVTDCALGNGVVHQNLGLLLTGITSARNVSTRSRGRRFPWAMTPPSRKRKCPSCSVVLWGLHTWCLHATGLLGQFGLRTATSSRLC